MLRKKEKELVAETPGDGFELFTGISRAENGGLKISKTGAVYLKRSFFKDPEKERFYDLYYDRSKKIIAVNFNGKRFKVTYSGGANYLFLKPFLRYFDIPHPVNCNAWENEDGVLFLQPITDDASSMINSMALPFASAKPTIKSLGI